jgi:ADP-ribosylglycohydrolase
MGQIIITLINRPAHADPKTLMRQTCDSFATTCKSVHNLARSQADDEQLYKELCEANPKFRGFNKQLKDRDWNWRSPTHTYAPTRLKQQPGYIGSYCMDALAMALHTVWFTSSFKEVAIMNADMGGDCDTVGSIAGQIAGAMYGVDEAMLRLYSQMVDFRSGRYEAFVKGYKLVNKKLLK